MSEEQTRNVYTTFGLVLVGWSFIEMETNQWAALAYHNGGRAVQPKLPKSFDFKVKFLRDCFKEIPALQPFASEASTILSRLPAIADVRDWLVHGKVDSYKLKGDKIVLVKMDVWKNGTIHKINTRTISMARLLQFGTEALDTVRGMRALAPQLIQSVEGQNHLHD